MENVPLHIAFIMDGNRRWAAAKSKNTRYGHQKGYEKMREVTRWCLERGVKVVTFFAFSTENWKRSKREVGYLMRLLKRAVSEGLEEFEKRGVRIQVIGSRKELSRDIQAAIEKAERRTAKNNKATVVIAINYGGRKEIIDALRRIVEENIPFQRISESLFSRYIYTAGLPDPDCIVRTSGETRLSGFLPWQSVYSELFFPKVYWPAFSKRDFERILSHWQKRERRFGG